MIDNRLDEFEFNPDLDTLFKNSRFVRFKGGSKPKQPTSVMPDTEMRKYARETLYPMVEAGMEGQGYGGAGPTAMRSRSLYQGLEKAYGEAQSGLDSQMARTLDPADSRVRNYMTNSLSREYTTAKDDISRQVRAEKVSDVDTSMALASDYLAGEKRMAVSSAQSYNQAMQNDFANMQRVGTFGTNVASGLGSALGDFYFAQQMGQG